jgi:hypothetical protein
VLFYLLNRDVPALNGMTLRAIRSHLSLVDVIMTILAILPHIRKNRFYVALHALNLFVHATQRIPCFIVIKLGNSFDGLPSCGSVAVFAWSCKRGTVRTAARVLLRGSSLLRSCSGSSSRLAPQES